MPDAPDLQAAGIRPPAPDDRGLLGAMTGQQPGGQGVMGAASILSGFASGLQGWPNPIVAQQAQAMRDQVAMGQAVLSVRRERRAQRESLQGLLGDLARSDVLEAKDAGLRGLWKMAQEVGLQLPDLREGLLKGAIKPAEMEEAGKMLVRGVPPQLIQQTYPWATPQVLEGMKGQGMDMLAASLKIKTSEQLRKESAQADREELKAIKEGQFPELAGPFGQWIHTAHTRANKGLNYFEGTTESRLAAQKQGQADYLAHEASKAGAHQGQIIVVEPTGGAFYDTRTHQKRSAVTRGELEGAGGAIHSINATELQRSQFAGLAKNTLMSLKVVVPKLLATQPGENLARALSLQGEAFVASNPDLRQFRDMAFKADVEIARVLQGGSVVRQQLLRLVEKYVGVGTTDTVATAIRVIDNNLLDVENADRGVFADPAFPLLPTTGGVRMGPGTYWAKDKVTGQTVPIVLKPGQISSDRYDVIRER